MAARSVPLGRSSGLGMLCPHTASRTAENFSRRRQRWAQSCPCRPQYGQASLSPPSMRVIVR
eukprot:12860158-Alexandrium_andersonii.AAC.1